MPDFNRPVRNYRSLVGLSNLADEFVNLDYRNAVEQRKQEKEMARKARTAQLIGNLNAQLSTIGNAPESYNLRNNARRSVLGQLAIESGEPEKALQYSIEDAPKVIDEPVKKNLVSRPTGNTKTEKGLQFEEYADVDPTQPFDQSKLLPNTPRYWKPAGNVPAGSGENQTAKDLEEYRTKYNESNASVKQIEDIYGKDKLMQWNQSDSHKK